MTTATAAIFKILNETFATLDAKMVVDQKTWAAGRVAAIKEYKAASNRREMGEWKYYAGLFATAGGKTWSKILSGSPAAIESFIEKNCRAIAEKRNANIAKKLAAEGITEVLSSEVAYSNDGFNGTFKVETTKGTKTININTIYAGGYNIQCFHQRTLVRVW